MISLTKVDDNAFNVMSGSRQIAHATRIKRKWFVVAENGLENEFFTKKQVVEWATAVNFHTSAAKHLQTVRNIDVDVPTSESLSYFHESISEGACSFLVVLQSFARTMGLTVTSVPPALLQNPSGVWGAFTIPNQLYLRPHRSEIAMCNVLAHEISHYYEYHLYHDNLLSEKREQLAEAVAYSIMTDYGYDATVFNFPYIQFWSQGRAKGLREGVLDNAFINCYAAFSEDLRSHLELQ
jgi:hypothetical protein